MNLLICKCRWNGRSFKYWLDLLLYISESKLDSFNIMNFYDNLAKKYNSSSSRVERVLRYGKSKIEKQIMNKYNIKTKIQNETIVNIFILKVF